MKCRFGGAVALAFLLGFAGCDEKRDKADRAGKTVPAKAGPKESLTIRLIDSSGHPTPGIKARLSPAHSKQGEAHVRSCEFEMMDPDPAKQDLELWQKDPSNHRMTLYAPCDEATSSAAGELVFKDLKPGFHNLVVDPVFRPGQARMFHEDFPSRPIFVGQKLRSMALNSFRCGCSIEVEVVADGPQGARVPLKGISVVCREPFSDKAPKSMRGKPGSDAAETNLKGVARFDFHDAPVTALGFTASDPTSGSGFVIVPRPQAWSGTRVTLPLKPPQSRRLTVELNRVGKPVDDPEARLYYSPIKPPAKFEGGRAEIDGGEAPGYLARSSDSSGARILLLERPGHEAIEVSGAKPGEGALILSLPEERRLTVRTRLTLDSKKFDRAALGKLGEFFMKDLEVTLMDATRSPGSCSAVLPARRELSDDASQDFYVEASAHAASWRLDVWWGSSLPIAARDDPANDFWLSLSPLNAGVETLNFDLDVGHFFRAAIARGRLDPVLMVDELTSLVDATRAELETAQVNEIDRKSVSDVCDRLMELAKEIEKGE